MPKLFVVRHAEPELAGVLLGRSDPELTERGREEAREKLGSLSVAAVYSSPLKRALATAQLIPAERLIVLDDLAEIDLGEWEGLPWAEIEQRDPLLARRKLEDWMKVIPPGGESWAMLRQRVGRALECIACGPFPAAIVGHAAVNAEIARRVAGADPIRFEQKYCEVIEYDFDPHR